MGQVQRPRGAATDDSAGFDRDDANSPRGERHGGRPRSGHRLGDHPVARADSDIRADLDARLAAVEEFDPEQVELVVREGVVLMLGTVADQATKRRLEDLAASVRGVREIHDQLQISSESSPAHADGLRVAEGGEERRTRES